MAEPFSEEFDNLLNKPLETITPNYRADAEEQALQLRNLRPSLKQFLPQYLAGDVLGAGNYLGGGISDALSFGANLINQPKIGSKLAEFADQNYAQGSRFLKEGMFGGLGSVPEALFTGDTVPTPGEMQDTNFLQNPVITKIMNEAGEEAFDDLLKNSAPKTFDAFTEESVMGMAPPVGDPAKARALKEAETKKAIDDEAALNKREKALGDTKIDSAPSSTEDLFSSAMQDVIASVRGTGPDTPEQKTIDDYKKEFSEATGIDVSGKVDKSAALMAMGLSLMQNKAGKGFNVGKMLSAVGEAGEKALPELTKAKATAKAEQVAAGKYALGQIQAGKSASAALAIERRALNQARDLKILELNIDAKKDKKAGLEVKGVKNVKYFNGFDVEMGRNATGAKFALPGSALNKTESAMKRINGALTKTDEIDVLLSSYDNAGNFAGTAGEIALNRAKAMANRFGAEFKFKDGSKLDPRLQIESLGNAIIAEYKKMLTQESGNGISNTDVNRLVELLGKPGELLTIEQLQMNVGAIREIFLSKKQDIDGVANLLQDPAYYALESEWEENKERAMNLKRVKYNLVDGDIVTSAIPRISVISKD